METTSIQQILSISVLTPLHRYESDEIVADVILSSIRQENDGLKPGVGFDVYHMDDEDEDDDDDFVMRSENRVHQPDNRKDTHKSTHEDAWEQDTPHLAVESSVSNSFDFAGFADFDSFNEATEPFSAQPAEIHEELTSPAVHSPAFADFADFSNVEFDNGNLEKIADDCW